MSVAMLSALAGPVASLAGDVLDRVIPDPAERDKAKAELQRLSQQGELQELETRLSAILAEAKSQDPWTSRARPSFMYVMYVMILTSIPMGILAAVSPETAAAIGEGMARWLGAIPDGMWATFGAGYLGYAASRSAEKLRGKA